ncbi:class I SAM-dependent methyltransferase [Tolypothrix sp. VBCCA 56010]|uniref:class I SAM-dependent methyltransferase n=1 Tax=Tolypothrix sp. VBCCA 56010 TaxID=3137731 RepID=UPI003D7EBCF4
MKDNYPERKVSEEERFQSDYYSYLEQPENATRYTLPVHFLEDAFQKRSFSLLDLGSGNGALLKYLPSECDYVGVDHSEYSIEYCLKQYPNRTFVCSDLWVFMQKLATENKKFDAVVLSGMIYNTVDKESEEHKDEQEIIQFCLDKIISDKGYLVIIVGFSYGTHPAHSLFVRGEWLQKSVEKMLSTAKANIVYENMSLQIGLEKKIGQQKVIPEWFVQDASTDYSSKFPGTYRASWTFIASPSF